jgi:hypothetical protein
MSAIQEPLLPWSVRGLSGVAADGDQVGVTIPFPELYDSVTAADIEARLAYADGADSIVLVDHAGARSCASR